MKNCHWKPNFCIIRIEMSDSYWFYIKIYGILQPLARKRFSMSINADSIILHIGTVDYYSWNYRFFMIQNIGMDHMQSDIMYVKWNDMLLL